ncbi:MAG TPA: hypothetical protein VIM35_07865 [Gallionella sp.]
MSAIQIWELLGYVVTVIGLPLAVFVSIIEQRKERDNEEEVGIPSSRTIFKNSRPAIRLRKTNKERVSC